MMRDPSSRYIFQCTFELYPGVESGADKLVPLQDQIDGIPAHSELRTCHLVFARSHLTLAFARKIDALPSKYRAWLWDAGFRDTLRTNVMCAERACLYSVNLTAKKKRAVVVINRSLRKEMTAKVDLPNAGPFAVVTPRNLNSGRDPECS